MRSLILMVAAFAAVALAGPVTQPDTVDDVNIDGEIELGTAIPDIVAYGAQEGDKVTYYKQPVEGKIIVSGGARSKGGKWGGDINISGQIRFSKTPEEEAAETVNGDEVIEKAVEEAAGYGIKISGKWIHKNGKWTGGVNVGGSISFSDVDALADEQKAAAYKQPVTGKIFVKGDGRGKGGKWKGEVIVGGEIRFTAPAEEVGRYTYNGEDMVLYKQPVEGKIIVSGGARGKGGKWSGDVVVRGEIRFCKPLSEVTKEEEKQTGDGDKAENYKIRIGGHIGKHKGKWHGKIHIGGSISFNAAEPEDDDTLAYKEPVTGKIIVSGGARGKGGKWGGNIHIGGQIRF